MVFDAPFNRQVIGPRLFGWSDWRAVLLPLLGKVSLKAIADAQAAAVPVSVRIDNADESNKADDDDDEEEQWQRARQRAAAAGAGRDRTPSDALLEQLYTIPMFKNMARTRTSLRPIGMVKLKRDCSTSSNSSVGSHKSSSEIRRSINMLQSSNQRISPEHLATIVSGSLSLLNDDDDNYMELHSEDEGSSVTSGFGEADGSATAAADAEELRQRIRELESKLARRQAEHRESVDKSQRKMALEADDADAEGLQLFRRAYAFWKGK